MRPCTSRDLSQKRMLFQHSRKGLEWKILKYLINSNEAISDALARHLARLCLPFIWLENISNRCLPVCRRYYTVDPWLLPPGNPFKCHGSFVLAAYEGKIRTRPDLLVVWYSYSVPGWSDRLYFLGVFCLNIFVFLNLLILGTC